jgi:hypothetical protein
MFERKQCSSVTGNKSTNIKVKVKVIIDQATKALRGRRGVA